MKNRYRLYRRTTGGAFYVHMIALILCPGSLKLAFITVFRHVQFDFERSGLLFRLPEQFVEETWVVSCPARLNLGFLAANADRFNRWRRVQDLLPIPLVTFVLVNREEHFNLVLEGFDFQPSLFQS